MNLIENFRRKKLNVESFKDKFDYSNTPEIQFRKIPHKGKSHIRVMIKSESTAFFKSKKKGEANWKKRSFQKIENQSGKLTFGMLKKVDKSSGKSKGVSLKLINRESGPEELEAVQEIEADEVEYEPQYVEC